MPVERGDQGLGLRLRESAIQVQLARAGEDRRGGKHAPIQNDRDMVTDILQGDLQFPHGGVLVEGEEDDRLAPGVLVYLRGFHVVLSEERLPVETQSLSAALDRDGLAGMGPGAGDHQIDGQRDRRPRRALAEARSARAGQQEK